MSMPTTYEKIPDRVKDALKGVYTDHGVELWWNARNSALQGVSPRDLWGQDRGPAAVTGEIAAIIARRGTHLPDQAEAGTGG